MATPHNQKTLSTEILFNISEYIPEVSGAVFDKKSKQFWTLPDSGNPPLLGRTDSQTFETTTFKIAGAKNEDWEALLIDREHMLWILDVGDNDAIRDHVTLYRVDPSHAQESAQAPKELPIIQQINVVYPEGPMNVEAGAILGNRIFLFEKTLTGHARTLSVDISPSVTNPSDLPPMRVVRDEGELPLLAGPHHGCVALADGKPLPPHLRRTL
ncbi:hypothetical protein WDW86_04390 [Bdellovibrionota bacterium FG-2]